MGWLRRLLLLVLTLAMAGWVINQYVVVKTRESIYRADGPIPQVDAVIVPGASVYRSGKLSPVLRQRMETALGFLEKQPGARLVLSGFAIPGGYNETLAMEDYARRRHVAPENILTDEKGRSTYVTLLNCRRKWGLRRVLVVSQDYHLPRALYIAHGLGMEASGLAVPEENPTSRVHFREYVGRVKDFLLLRMSKYLNAN
ncbi:MAG TPA: YdcF family protein [Fibrobacteria bacterium]|nr:YdcF family protein [Fibrobacteria bacterium]